MIDHETGYARVSTSPIIGPGNAGSWDDFDIYAPAVTKVDGTYYLFYAGGQNISGNPNIQMEIGLATSTDTVTWTKQGRKIPKSMVSPATGLAPFSILNIDGVWHLFVCVFQPSTPIYRCAYFTFDDIDSFANLAGPFFLNGLTAQSHAPCVIEDPEDSSKLILYYTKMLDFQTQRAVADKSDPSNWSNLVQIEAWTAIYPNVRYIDGKYEYAFAKPVSTSPQMYSLFMTRALDSQTMRNASGPLIQNGASGSFDENYMTTPFLFEDMLFYSGRNAVSGSYHGIGLAKLAQIGGVQQWDWFTGAVGKSTVPYTGSYGGRIVYSSTLGTGTLNKCGEGRDKVYSIWIYDAMETNTGFQTTLRLIPEADAVSVPQLTLGIYSGSSTSKYVYRLRNGSWTASSINRTAGWHEISFEVGDDVVMKIDGVTVATDTAFDTSAPFNVTLQGGSYGTAYVDDFSVSDLT